jgi:regulator of sirC expression with transglutaminase-like and TPR domain
MPVNALKTMLDRPNTVPMSRWLALNALDPSEWKTVFGAHWSRKGGQIRVESPGAGFGGRALCLYQKSPPSVPYEIAVKVRLEDESGAAGLAFGSDGEDRHYGFYPTAGQLRLTRFDGPSVYSWSILQQTNTPLYRPGDWNSLRVRVEKEKIQCYLNGQLVMEADEVVSESGKVGLAKFRDTIAAFRDFRIGTNLPNDDLAGGASLEGDFKANVSRVASAALDEEIQSRPQLARHTLQERARILEKQAAELREMGDRIHRQAVQKELQEELSKPEESIDLFKASLLVAKFDNPDLEIAPYQEEIAEMGRELKSKITSDSDSAARLKVLLQYLFQDNGFHGSRSDYYNRANSYLSDVLDDREGLPITLSILFLELAHRIGLKSDGIPLPGHFIVQVSLEPDQTEMIDVFEGGKKLTRTDAAEIVSDFTGEGLREDHLRPAKKSEIISRMVRNLLGIARRGGGTEQSLKYLDLLVAISPNEPNDRLERAMLQIQSGERSRAKVDLKWLMDHDPIGFNMERISELYKSLE